MDGAILGNFRMTLRPGDTLYLLGDLSFSDFHIKEFFRMFAHVKIIFIRGNHDGRKLTSIAREFNIPVYPLLDIQIEGQPITLCHYAMRVWNKSHFNAWNLHGHSHGTLPPQGKQHDVGVDSNGFFPISWDRLKRTMQSKPDNENFIKE